jgi:putative cardiolipin synthase
MRVGGKVFRNIMAGVVVTVAAVLIAPAQDVDHESLRELVTRVGRARWSWAHDLELLADANRSWNARLELAESVQHHLFISTFSWHNDEYGKGYRHELRKVAKRLRRNGSGFDLRILGDATALQAWDPAFSGLEMQGARVRGFNRPSWGLTPVFDGRMHDKVIIVDGRRAIVTGRNFANHYYDPDRWWLDLGVMFEGEAVTDLQMNFLKSWELTRFVRSVRRYLLPQEMLRDELRLFWRTGRFKRGHSPLEKYMNRRYFPRLEQPAHAVPVAILYDNPLLRRRAATVDLLTALAERAEQRIDLMTPFPNLLAETTDAIVAAARRGVRVRLYTNSQETTVRGGPRMEAAYPTLIRLLESGVTVWEWAPGDEVARAIEASDCDPELMPPFALHGKMVRIDDELSIVTSSNFNVRSALYNTEAGVVVLDRGFSDTLGSLLESFSRPEWSSFGCADPGFDLPPLIREIGPGGADRMREELGSRQPRLDRWSVLW